MRYLKVGFFFLIAFLLQTSLLNMINIGGYTPNLLLSLVIILSFLYKDEMYGITYGTIFGLLYDICFGYVIGPTPISLLLTALVVLIVREYANIENIVSMWVVSAFSFVFYYVVNWGLYRISGISVGLMYALSNSMWVILYSMVVVTLIYIKTIKEVVKHHKDRYFR
jgi:rod shape-determining protein MreD